MDSMKWKCKEIKHLDITKLDITFFTGGLDIPRDKEGNPMNGHWLDGIDLNEFLKNILDCEYCGDGIPKDLMDDHLKNCEARKKYSS